ncbi:hypothetical protein [Ornithinibacillus halophilus]|uniref:Uncharacterized protein n=1 Tax=Ornithinibacillus halophilus TaxID=930117 RepID=A0A1M5FVB9_9BACI|nr:hypothetical protein [Ornithinibacillus halophilus]SHF95141.1 hypothetical protein SAMN05216225_101032 [Ornithinibacillus halophilus]
MIRKPYSLLSVVVLFLLAILLVACSDGEDSNEENQSNHNTNSTENEEVNDEQNSADNSTEEEEELPGLDLRVLDIEQVQYDAESWDNYNPDEHLFLEHDQRLYVSHQITSDLLGINIQYDADNLFAEVLEGESDYQHETIHTDHSSAIVEVNEYWRYDHDDYWMATGAEEDYHFLEYEGNLYIPQRVVEMIGYAPIRYDRSQNTINFGLLAEPIDMFENAEVSNSSGSLLIEPRNSYTFEGENLGAGYYVEFGTRTFSSGGAIEINTNGEYKELVIDILSVGTSDSKDMDVEVSDYFGHVDSITIPAQETETLTIDISGRNAIIIEITNNIKAHAYFSGTLR